MICGLAQVGKCTVRMGPVARGQAATGDVRGGGVDAACTENARELTNSIVAEPEEGKIYKGKVASHGFRRLRELLRQARKGRPSLFSATTTRDGPAICGSVFVRSEMRCQENMKSLAVNLPT